MPLATKQLGALVEMKIEKFRLNAKLNKRGIIESRRLQKKQYASNMSTGPKEGNNNCVCL